MASDIFALNGAPHVALIETSVPPPQRCGAFVFGGAKNGRVPIEFCELLTLDWLTSKSSMIENRRKKS
jgi:hypothetical protein